MMKDGDRGRRNKDRRGQKKNGEYTEDEWLSVNYRRMKNHRWRIKDTFCRKKMIEEKGWRIHVE